MNDPLDAKEVKAKRPKVRPAPGDPVQAGAALVESAGDSGEAAATSVAPVAASFETVPAIVDQAIEAASPVAETVFTDAAQAANDVSIEAAEAVLANEGNEQMATITNPTEGVDKAQAMFGDMSARFKTAFEKSARMGEEFVDFTKGNVEALVASARVAAKASESLGQEAAEYGKKHFENATAAFKSFAAVKSPTELFQLQSDFAKSSFDSAVAEASRVSESLLKVAGEIAQPISNRYAVAAEKFKAATL